MWSIAQLCAGANSDYYSALVKWQSSSGLQITPIHAGLLPTGDVFLVNSYDAFVHSDIATSEPEYLFTMTPTAAYSMTPDVVALDPRVNPSVLHPTVNTQTNTLRLKAMVCGGHSLMADGSLFFAGGQTWVVDLSTYDRGGALQSLQVDGIAESLTFDPFTNSWRQNPNMIVPGPLTNQALRWYGTVTRLADSRLLATGGYEKAFPTLAYNPSVEIFDPAANAWTKISDTSETPPGIENPDYTHVFQFPYAYTSSAGTPVNIVLMLGGSGEPMLLFLDGQTKYWLGTQQYRPGAKDYIDSHPSQKVFPNFSSSTALLPLRLPEDSWGYYNGSIINVGGEAQTPMESHIDVYDPIAGAWRPSITMSAPRQHPSTVLLPDGRVLILAGHNEQNGAGLGYAEYVDPRNNFALSRGAAYMPETRGYHTVTLLLPDGRVLLGSGNVDGVDGVERTDFRYYYPDYMFKDRPQIAFADDTATFSQYFAIAVPHGTSIGEAALVGLGAMTHSFDMSQRHVQLRTLDPQYIIGLIDGQWTQATADQCADARNVCYDLELIEAPESKELAPPGYYMFFILDADRVPSMGKIIKLQG